MLQLQSSSRYCCYSAVINSIPSSRHLQRSLESISDKPAFLTAILKSQKDSDLTPDLLDESTHPVSLIESLHTSLRSQKFKMALHRIGSHETLSASVYEKITEPSNMLFLVFDTSPGSMAFDKMIDTFDSIRFNVNGLTLSSIVLFKHNYYISAKRSKSKWTVKGLSQENIYTNWNNFVISCFETEVVPVYLVYKRRKRQVEQERLSEHSKQILRGIYSAINEDECDERSDSEENLLEHLQIPQRGTPIDPIYSEIQPTMPFIKREVKKTREKRLPDILFSSSDDEEYYQKLQFKSKIKTDNYRNKKKQNDSFLDALDDLIDDSGDEVEIWTCKDCKIKNDRARCLICFKENKPRKTRRDWKQKSNRGKSQFHAKSKRKQSFWECIYCGCTNDEDNMFCTECERLAP